jgi:small-conductance mechanosensitive channel
MTSAIGQTATSLILGVTAQEQQLLSKDLPLTLAAVSASVGAVVAFFVLFGLRVLEREKIEEATAHRLNIVIMEHAALTLILTTSAAAMVALLVTPLFLFYNLAAAALASSTSVAIALGTFSFSLTMLIVGLVSFVIVPTVSRRQQMHLLRSRRPTSAPASRQ